MSTLIYLDNNATTRPAPEVIAAVGGCLERDWANPSSKHPAGQDAKRTLAAARASVAALLGAQANEVVFTSGATEANHIALFSALAREGAPQRVLLSAIEHSSFLKAAQRLAQRGVELVLLPVDCHGRVRLEAVQTELAAGAALLSVMTANNETGVLQPVAELATLAKAAGVPFHVDATQSIGKQAIDFAALGADLMSLSAHKLHGPKGVGALVVRKGFVLSPLFLGSQERGRRGGTENLPGIIGFAVAAELARERLARDAAHMRGLRDALEHQLYQRLVGLTVWGAQVPRLPNTSLLRIGNLDADLVLGRLERDGLCASSGAACSSGGSDPSHVLLAMGVDAREALGALRLSLSRETTAEEVARCVEIFVRALPEQVRDEPMLRAGSFAHAD